MSILFTIMDSKTATQFVSLKYLIIGYIKIRASSETYPTGDTYETKGNVSSQR